MQVSSEEDVPVFHRNLKTASDDGLDEGPPDWEDEIHDYCDPSQMGFQRDGSSSPQSNVLPPDRGLNTACSSMLSELGLAPVSRATSDQSHFPSTLSASSQTQAPMPSMSTSLPDDKIGLQSSQVPPHWVKQNTWVSEKSSVALQAEPVSSCTKKISEDNRPEDVVSRFMSPLAPKLTFEGLRIGKYVTLWHRNDLSFTLCHTVLDLFCA